MPYINDASTAADVISPAYAAQQIGMQNDIANQKEQMANQVYQQTMPALEQEPGLKNLFTQAQTGVQQGMAQQEQAKGNVAQALVPSTIGAGQAGNQLKMTQDQVGKLATFGQLAGQVAGMMDNVPPPARPAAMQQLLQQNGIDASQLGPLASGDPDLLRVASQHMIQASSDYQTKLMQENVRGQSMRDVAETQSSGRVQAAGITAQARETVANIQAKVKQQLANIDQQISQLTTRIGTSQEQQGDRERLQFLSQQEITTRQFGAETTRALIGMGTYPGSGIQGEAPPTLNIPQQGGSNNAPVQPTQSPPGQGFPSASEIEAEMKRRGLLK
jgi:hypothetical protein